MIGYYVHHLGRGHLSHAMAVIARLDEPVTVLSSLPCPALWSGDWIELARDDGGAPQDVDAHGVLHWAPVHHRGLQRRMAAITAWIESVAPTAMVVDLSVEVVVLARLLGVPVVTFCLPGKRMDRPHRLAWDLADAIIAPWPERYAGLCGTLAEYAHKVHFTGAFSRFDARDVPTGGRRPLHGVVLGGLGGTSSRGDSEPALPGWTWTVLDGTSWCADPWPELCRADVVITHAGLAALGEVAAARAPAVVRAEPRPYAEQQHTAAMLLSDSVTVVASGPDPCWSDLVERARTSGGSRWDSWSDLGGAARAATVIEQVAGRDVGVLCASR